MKKEKVKENNNNLESTSNTVKAPEFSVAQLREKAQILFGVSDSTFAAAAYNLNGTFTVEDMRGRIEAFLSKKIKGGKK